MVEWVAQGISLSVLGFVVLVFSLLSFYRCVLSFDCTSTGNIYLSLPSLSLSFSGSSDPFSLSRLPSSQPTHLFS